MKTYGNASIHPDPEFGNFGSVGLTKRELIAAMAMAGICGDGIPGSHHSPEQTAMDAVAYADALIEALNKEENQ